MFEAEPSDFATAELLAVEFSAVSLLQLDKNTTESNARVDSVFFNFITHLFIL
jgi:hypothetical protein